MEDCPEPESALPDNPMKTTTVAVHAVTVRDRHREASEERISALAESMNAIGLQTPISVWISGHGEDVEVHLVAGLHRLRAAEMLGWADIEALEVDLDEIDRELWEIDENLCRAELTEAQETAHLARRKVLWQRRRETGGKSFSTSLSDGRGAGPQHEKAFATETAAATGKTKQSINQKLARAVALGDDVEKVVGTSLDKGVEMDALAKMPEPERAALIDRAQAGERVSARSGAGKRAKASEDNDLADEAAEKIAEALAEHIPGGHWATLVANLSATDTKRIAKAFRRLTGVAVFDNTRAA